MIEQKPWGRVIEIHRTPSLHIVQIEVWRGGYSSFHLHQHKNNIFLCLKGRLQIGIGEEPIVNPVELEPGTGNSILMVPAGVPHRFLAMADTIALEIYTPASSLLVEPADILRFSENGRKDLP